VFALNLNEDVEMRSPLVALTLCVSIAPGLVSRASAAEPTPTSVWMTDFAVAQAQAKKLNRPLVVHFHAKWCAPCKRMEREVLDTAQVLKTLEGGFVAVKVDVEKNDKLKTKYGISGLPTDIIFSPGGTQLSRTQGYDADVKQKYLPNVVQIDARYSAERKRLASSLTAGVASKATKPEVAQKTSAPPRIDRPAGALPSTPGDKLVPPAKDLEPKKIASVPAASGTVNVKNPEPNKTASVSGASGTAGAGKDKVPEQKKIASVPGTSNTAAPVKEEKKEPVATATGTTIALDGYCPVTLRSTRTWKPGEKNVSLEHDGQTFYFAAPDMRDEFKSHPDRYAPRLLGCDPVVLGERDLVVRGSTKFGAFYDGELFLFKSADTRTKFRKDPIRYARLKHVLKPEDMTKIATAAK
jgi:YHS domain-containing protein/thiol-disulfide isomerase/thioredoxin